MQDASIPMRSIQWDSSWPRLLNHVARRELLSYLEREFGFPPSLYMPYDFLQTSRTIYIFRGLAHSQRLSDLKIQNLGLPAIRRLGRHLKPTTQFVQLFGRFATKKVLDVDEEALRAIAKKGEIPVPPNFEQGFYILKSGPYFWGLALYVGQGRLVSYLSKQVREVIREKSSFPETQLDIVSPLK